MKPLRALAALIAVAVFSLATSRAIASGPPLSCSTNAECDDGDPCTDDLCTPFGCLHSPIICNDFDGCTTDSCQPFIGCVFTVADCDDQDACTADSCDALGGCQNEPITCNDFSECTVDSCDPQIGCVFAKVDCDDQNPCTADSCDAQGGCRNEPITCNDFSECTVDSCDPQIGCVFAAVDCNDQDACTVDFCEPAKGCGHTVKQCLDNNACTNERCDPGQGCIFTPVDCDDSNVCTIDSCDKTTGCSNAEIECDDRNACTDDTCDAETGCGSTPVVCDDGDPCTTETCDVETGCESGPPVDCDDHDACTTDSCDAEAGCTHSLLASCAPPHLDHFQCYESHRPPLNERGVSVVDQFGASTVVVRRAKRLCAPANKNGEDPDAVNAAGHLTTYTIRQISPHFTGEKDVKVQNQFGEITVDLYRPERLLVPTSKSLVGPPAPLVDDLDHFKCYRVRGARFRKKGVTVETQFGPEVVDIKQPRHLCAPADKKNESPGAENHQLHLMCYLVRSATQRPLEVFTNDQFGPDHYDIYGLRELCVPSFKNPGTCGNGTIDALGETCEPPGAVCAADGRTCSQDCTCPAPACGDGFVNQPTEQCDDGNATPNDGCSPSCEIEP